LTSSSLNVPPSNFQLTEISIKEERESSLIALLG
jgi:hypothetical protein